MKYKAEPLIATARYYSLFSLISLVLISASINLAATSLAYVFVLFNTSMSSWSSSRDPFELISLSRRFLSSSFRSFLFLFTSDKICYKLSSKAFYSFEITLPNNYYSRPPYVTVKSIIVVLAESSGENNGIDYLVDIYSLNLSWNSSYVPPTSINLFFPLT